MPVRPPLPRLLRLPIHWRLTGLGCALLIWMLGLAGASELLHDEIHEHDHSPEHACAITLFALGAENPAASATFTLAPEERAVAILRLHAVVAPAIVDRPLRPGRDPPAGEIVA